MPGVFGQSMKYPNYFNITYLLYLGIIYNEMQELLFLLHYACHVLYLNAMKFQDMVKMAIVN
jgi:hypothetical protein